MEHQAKNEIVLQEVPYAMTEEMDEKKKFVNLPSSEKRLLVRLLTCEYYISICHESRHPPALWLRLTHDRMPTLFCGTAGMVVPPAQRNLTRSPIPVLMVMIAVGCRHGRYTTCMYAGVACGEHEMRAQLENPCDDGALATFARHSMTHVCCAIVQRLPIVNVMTSNQR
jgi:hypothetical protein